MTTQVARASGRDEAAAPACFASQGARIPALERRMRGRACCSPWSCSGAPSGGRLDDLDKPEIDAPMGEDTGPKDHDD